MEKNKRDILGALGNILSNIDINQITSLISSFTKQSGNSSNPGSVLGNMDLGKLSEFLAGLNLGKLQNQETKASSFNSNNFGSFNLGNLDSLISSVSDQLEGLRKFRF